MKEEDKILHTRHIVSEGETLEDIALMYETSSDKISLLNKDISNSDLITGKKLYISEFPSYYLSKSQAAATYCDPGEVPDDCNVCNGGTFFCSSSGCPCDCESSTLDCAGNCGGTASTDDCGVCGGGTFFGVNAPGNVCDCDNNFWQTCPDGSLQCGDCVIYGCTDTSASNYNSDATVDDGTCCSSSNCGCMDENADNYNVNATQDDGSCEYTTKYGCTDIRCSNYDSSAEEDDGSCNCSYGCTDANDCCYNENADTDDGTCCPEESPCVGCMDGTACNFNPNATQPDQSCYFKDCDADPPCGECIEGCTDPEACNFDSQAEVSCANCCSIFDVCGECGGNGSSCQTPVPMDPIVGCMDENACNFNSDATDDGACSYLDDCGVCGGSNESCIGCTNFNACNYDPNATISGYCDYQSCAGCTDSSACNFTSGAIIDDGTCTYDCIKGCTDPGACNYNVSATEDDGTCEYESCASCGDPSACNYPVIVAVITNNSLCEYESCAGCTDSTACNYDPNATISGSCDYESCKGCTSNDACNTNPFATQDDGSCEYESCKGCMDGRCPSYDPSYTISDPSSCDCVEGCADISACNPASDPSLVNINIGCEYETCKGCTDNTACNPDFDATIDDGSCEYESCKGCMDGRCPSYDPSYTVSDPSSCDCVLGCMDAYACNTNHSANVDDGSCEYASCKGCMQSDACNYLPTYTIPGYCDYETCKGCMISTASNYDSNATIEDNASCYWLGCTDDRCPNYSSQATVDDGSCDCIKDCMDSESCNENPDAHISDDSQCEYISCRGCMDSTACNWDEEATIEYNSDCEYANPCRGCMDSTACNYAPNAIEDDSSCEYRTCEGCKDEDACNYYSGWKIHNDADCDFYSCYGCMNEDACNVDPYATKNDEGQCDFESCYCLDSSACNAGLKGYCDYSCYGCTNSDCPNFKSSYTIDDGSCDCIYGCMTYEACNYNPHANVADYCDFTCYGCMNEDACNYEPSAIKNDETLCDLESCYGCTDEEACNYDPEMTHDDGSCSSYYDDCGDDDVCNCLCEYHDACDECGGHAIEQSGFPPIQGGGANACGECFTSPEYDHCDKCQNDDRSPNLYKEQWYPDEEQYPFASLPQDRYYTESELEEDPLGSGICDCPDGNLVENRCYNCVDQETGTGCEGTRCLNASSIDYYDGEGAFEYDAECPGSSPCDHSGCRYNYVRLSWAFCAECEEQTRGASRIWSTNEDGDPQVYESLKLDNVSGSVLESYKSIKDNSEMHIINGGKGKLLSVSRSILYACEAELDPYFGVACDASSPPPGSNGNTPTNCNSLRPCSYLYESCEGGSERTLVYEEGATEPNEEIQLYPFEEE